MATEPILVGRVRENCMFAPSASEFATSALQQAPPSTASPNDRFVGGGITAIARAPALCYLAKAARRWLVATWGTPADCVMKAKPAIGSSPRAATAISGHFAAHKRQGRLSIGRVLHAASSRTRDQGRDEIQPFRAEATVATAESMRHPVTEVLRDLRHFCVDGRLVARLEIEA